MRALDQHRPLVQAIHREYHPDEPEARANGGSLYMLEHVAGERWLTDWFPAGTPELN